MTLTNEQENLSDSTLLEAPSPKKTSENIAGVSKPSVLALNVWVRLTKGTTLFPEPEKEDRL